MEEPAEQYQAHVGQMTDRIGDIQCIGDDGELIEGIESAHQWYQGSAAIDE